MVSIVLVLVLITIAASSTMMEKARWTVDVGNMRTIGAAMVARGTENNDVLYWRREIGNSSYREYDDRLGLPYLLRDYVWGEKVWMSPGAHKRLEEYKNGYAWTRATELTDYDAETGQPPLMSKIERPHKTPLLWNAFNYTIPSVINVPEGASGGPRPGPAAYQYKPWQWRKKKNMLMMDLHVVLN